MYEILGFTGDTEAVVRFTIGDFQLDEVVSIEPPPNVLDTLMVAIEKREVDLATNLPPEAIKVTPLITLETIEARLETLEKGG